MAKKKKGIIVAAGVTIVVAILHFLGVAAPVVNLVTTIGQTVAATMEQVEEVPSPTEAN